MKRALDVFHNKDSMPIKFSLENLKERDHFDDVGVDGKKI